MTRVKCNRTVCLMPGLFAHVDIVIGHNGQPARYCEACAHTINRACRPMAGYMLVPTTVQEVAEVLLAKADARIAYDIQAQTDLAEPEFVLRRLAAHDAAIAELGRRLLAPMPDAPELRLEHLEGVPS